VPFAAEDASATSMARPMRVERRAPGKDRMTKEGSAEAGVDGVRSVGRSAAALYLVFEQGLHQLQILF